MTILKNNNNNNLIQELKENRINKTLNSRLANTYEIINDLKVNMDKKIEISNTKNAIRILARLGYSAGSNIGLITKLSFIYTVLIDNKFNKAFLKSDNTVDINLLRKVFHNLNTNPKVDGYEKIYSLEKSNMIKVLNLQGRQMVLLMSLKSDVELFAKRIEEAKSLTQEDLVNIGKDLEKISRLLGEFDIDSAKDASVKIGLKDITDFINSFTCKLASQAISVNDNFDKIIENKKAGNPIERLEYTLDDYISMNDVYKLSKEQYEAFKQNNLDMPDVDLKDEARNIFYSNLSDSYIEDPMLLVKKNILANQENFLNEIVDLYKQSDMSLFEQFKRIDLDIDENKIKSIQNVTVVAINIINSHFAYRKDISMSKIDTLGTQLRNMIYTHGSKLGVKPEDTFKIAMSAGWLYKGKNNNLSPVANPYRFKFAAINVLFENELKWCLNPEVMYSSIDVELPEGFALELNTPFNMVDGECEVVLENGDIDYIICTKEFDYTGQVMAILNQDNEVMFVKGVNEYEYETIDFLLFDEICDGTLETNSYIHGDLIGQAKAVTPLIEKFNYNATEAEKTLNHAINVEKFKHAFDLFNKRFRLPLVDDTFKYGLVKTTTNERYLTITKGDKSRMLGRLAVNNSNKRIAQYEYIDIMTCNKGSLIILK